MRSGHRLRRGDRLCPRTGDAGRGEADVSAVTRPLQEAAAWLVESGVTPAAMECTAIY